MLEIKPRSLDIWDYLGDMPYMPSREDRDQLIKAGEEKRVNIWDYFFRIDPNDAGKPQKNEIKEIQNRLSQRIAEHNRAQLTINGRIESVQQNLFQKRLNSFLVGAASFLIAGLFNKLISTYDLHYTYSGRVLSVLIIYGLTVWLTIGVVGWKEKREMRELREESQILRDNRDIYLKESLNRQNALRNEIKVLKKQIPPCPSNICVREWLNEDFLGLYNRSIQVTALENRLIKIDSGDYFENGKPVAFPNPIYVLGPGELQDSEKIPKTFTREIRPDLNKHLSAKRSYYLEEQNRFEVLYGVYYLEHILIADDMLATYGLFYDFITGKYHAEQITEQYYQDVVAITVTHEFREITLGANQKEKKYVEDAPTFTLSLSSGEHRKVTFVSKKYFMEIRDKINVDEDDVAKISWIGRAQADVDLASRALRSQLRLHKIVLNDE